jgi:hypothetical protein
VLARLCAWDLAGGGALAQGFRVHPQKRGGFVQIKRFHSPVSPSAFNAVSGQLHSAP